MSKGNSTFLIHIIQYRLILHFMIICWQKISIFLTWTAQWMTRTVHCKIFLIWLKHYRESLFVVLIYVYEQLRIAIKIAQELRWKCISLFLLKYSFITYEMVKFVLSAINTDTFKSMSHYCNIFLYNIINLNWLQKYMP